jgi:hypothetical protein
VTNRDWWDRARLPPRPQPIESRKRELLATLQKGRARAHAGEARRADDGRRVDLERKRAMATNARVPVGQSLADDGSCRDGDEARGWRARRAYHAGL